MGAAPARAAAPDLRRRAAVNERDIRLQSLRQAATARYRNGEFEAAEQLIGEALKLDPNSPELWSNRGTAQVAAKRQEAALASFTRALQLAPDFLGALANRAHVLFELQRYAEAIPDYEGLLARDPGHAYSAGNLVFCRLQCCDWTSFEQRSEDHSRAASRGTACRAAGAERRAVGVARRSAHRRARCWCATSFRPRPLCGAVKSIGMSGSAWRMCRRIFTRMRRRS